MIELVDCSSKQITRRQFCGAELQPVINLWKEMHPRIRPEQTSKQTSVRAVPISSQSKKLPLRGFDCDCLEASKLALKHILGYLPMFSLFSPRSVKRHFREERGKYENWKQEGITSLTKPNKWYPAKHIYPLAEFKSKYLESILRVLNFIRFRRVRAECQQEKRGISSAISKDNLLLL